MLSPIKFSVTFMDALAHDHTVYFNHSYCTFTQQILNGIINCTHKIKQNKRDGDAHTRFFKKRLGFWINIILEYFLTKKNTLIINIGFFGKKEIKIKKALYEFIYSNIAFSFLCMPLFYPVLANATEWFFSAFFFQSRKRTNAWKNR